MSATTRLGARSHQNPNRPQEQPRALPIWKVALHTQINNNKSDCTDGQPEKDGNAKALK